MHSETYDALRKVDRNKLALLASVFPGAGQFLKGHKVLGLTLLLGNVLMIFIAAWLAIATLGLSVVVVPVLWFGAVAASAYLIPDLTGHTAPPLTFLGEKIDHLDADDSNSTMTDDQRIDEAMKESYPASDPPSWNLGAKRHYHGEDGRKQGARGA